MLGERKCSGSRAWGLMGCELPRDHTALSAALELKKQRGRSRSPAEKAWGVWGGALTKGSTSVWVWERHWPSDP